MRMGAVDGFSVGVSAGTPNRLIPFPLAGSRYKYFVLHEVELRGILPLIP